MIYTTMKCECCGKEFSSLYWEDGYIAHVDNFVGNKDGFSRKGDLRYMAREIFFDGNSIRPQNVIKDLLKCFMTWDCFPEDFKHSVKKIVDALLSEILEANKKVDILKETTSPLVLAMLKEVKIDEAYFDLFDKCCEELGE